MLDELEHYWEQHDKISASSHKQQGIQRLHVDDMMLDDMMLLKTGKRGGAFCIGI